MPPTVPPVYLTPHFSLAELTFSQDAADRGWPNEPDAASRLNLVRTAEMLESIRQQLGNAPLIVSSGYRSDALNRLVKGSRDSAHRAGLAADFIAPRFGTPLDICRRIAESALLQRIDQLIFEGTWVHMGLAPDGAKPRAEVLTAKGVPGGKKTYVFGLPK